MESRQSIGTEGGSGDRPSGFPIGDVLELALIEKPSARGSEIRLRRQMAYRRLAEEFALRQEDIAQRVGKKSLCSSRNSIRLLDLHSQVQKLPRAGAFEASVMQKCCWPSQKPGGTNL